MEPRIIFEDVDLLVINKPAGMTVNRAETTKDQATVQDWVEKRFLATGPVARHLVGARLANKPLRANKASDSRHPSLDDFYNRNGVVHRLDKETSGLLLVAKTPQAFENLQRQFKERKVRKTYLALVHGEVKPETGEIRVPVGRLPWDRKKFGVVAGGREAITKYQVLSIMYHVLNKNKETLTLLELTPETGRTHQIRVHLKYAGHPIFGDPLYGGRKTAREDRKILPRIFLHAAKISFTHPKTGELLSFQSELPGELEELLKNFLTLRDKTKGSEETTGKS